MHRFRRTRMLAISTVLLPMVMVTVVATPAWAGHHRARTHSKRVKCADIGGTLRGSWYLMGCSPTSVVGNVQNPNPYQGTDTTPFPTSPTTITWSPVGGLPVGTPPLQTTIGFIVIPRTGHRDKCGLGSAEVLLKGVVLANSTAPGVKGRVHMFVCEAFNGALSPVKNRRGVPKPLKL